MSCVTKMVVSEKPNGTIAQKQKQVAILSTTDIVDSKYGFLYTDRVCPSLER